MIEDPGSLAGKISSWIPVRGVEPGADGGAAHGHLQQVTGGVLDLGDGVIKGADVAGPFLADGQRGSVLQMRAADLDDLSPRPRLALDGVAEPPERRDRLVRRHLVRRDVHGGREGVVGRLAHVHVIVRVNRLLRAEGAAH